MCDNGQTEWQAITTSKCGGLYEGDFARIHAKLTENLTKCCSSVWKRLCSFSTTAADIEGQIANNQSNNRGHFDAV